MQEEPIPKITDYNSPETFLKAAGIDETHGDLHHRMHMEQDAMDVRRFVGTLFGKDDGPTSAEGALEGWTHCLKITHWTCRPPPDTATTTTSGQPCKHIALVEQGSILDSNLKVITQEILSALASMKRYQGKMVSFFVRTKGLSVDKDNCSIVFAISGKREKEQTCRDRKLAVESKVQHVQCHTIVVPTRSKTDPHREVPPETTSYSWLDWDELCLRLLYGLRDESTAAVGLITRIAQTLQMKENDLRRFVSEVNTFLKSDIMASYLKDTAAHASDPNVIRFVTGTPRNVDTALKALLDVLDLRMEPTFAHFQNGCPVGMDYRQRHEYDIARSMTSTKDRLYGHLSRDLTQVAGIFKQQWKQAVSKSHLPVIAAALGHCSEDNLFHYLAHHQDVVSEAAYNVHIFFSARVPTTEATTRPLGGDSIRIYPPCGICHNHIHSDLQDLYRDFHMQQADRHVEAHMSMDYTYVGMPQMGMLVCRYRQDCKKRHYRLLPSAVRYPCEESLMESSSPVLITRMVRVISYNDDRHVGIPVQLDTAMDAAIEMGSQYYVQFRCKPVNVLMLYRHKHEGCCATRSTESFPLPLDYESFRLEEARIWKQQALVANRQREFRRAQQLCSRALGPLR